MSASQVSSGDESLHEASIRIPSGLGPGRQMRLELPVQHGEQHRLTIVLPAGAEPGGIMDIKWFCDRKCCVTTACKGEGRDATDTDSAGKDSVDNGAKKQLRAPGKKGKKGKALCRLCHKDGSKEGLVSPCGCRGELSHVHSSCQLEQIQHRLSTTGAFANEAWVCQVCDQDIAWRQRTEIDVDINQTLFGFIKDQIKMMISLCEDKHIFAVAMCMFTYRCPPLAGGPSCLQSWLLMLGLLMFISVLLDIEHSRPRDVAAWGAANLVLVLIFLLALFFNDNGVLSGGWSAPFMDATPGGSGVSSAALLWEFSLSIPLWFGWWMVRYRSMFAYDTAYLFLGSAMASTAHLLTPAGSLESVWPAVAILLLLLLCIENGFSWPSIWPETSLDQHPVHAPLPAPTALSDTHAQVTAVPSGVESGPGSSLRAEGVGDTVSAAAASTSAATGGVNNSNTANATMLVSTSPLDDRSRWMLPRFNFRCIATLSFIGRLYIVEDLARYGTCRAVSPPWVAATGPCDQLLHWFTRWLYADYYAEISSCGQCQITAEGYLFTFYGLAITVWWITVTTLFAEAVLDLYVLRSEAVQMRNRVVRDTCDCRNCRAKLFIV